ncbi:MAG: hypothetical protein IJ294_02495, partial [Clostridia bacterium]|nr:hypothetical protein [Clostridia bacterium]
NPADASKVAQVQSLINGYQWSFYVNYTSYKLEFEATNNFTLKTTLGSNSGTYSVLNGYVLLTYQNGNTVEIPYDIKDGKINLEGTDAFDVKE